MMEKEQFIKAIQEAKKDNKRGFSQTFDFIINLKDLDLKKPDNHVETWVQLPYSKGKPIKIACLIGPELKDQSKLCDTAIMHDDFPIYVKDKKKTKKLAEAHDFFIGQANIMPDIAKSFGRILGVRGKMPNPKAGCVVPPNANLKSIVEQLRKTIKLKAKLQPTIKSMVGNESMKDEEIAENMAAIYNQMIHILPKEKHNIKNMIIKTTMGKPIKITEK